MGYLLRYRRWRRDVDRFLQSPMTMYCGTRVRTWNTNVSHHRRWAFFVELTDDWFGWNREEELLVLSSFRPLVKGDEEEEAERQPLLIPITMPLVSIFAAFLFFLLLYVLCVLVVAGGVYLTVRMLKLHKV